MYYGISILSLNWLYACRALSAKRRGARWKETTKPAYQLGIPMPAGVFPGMDSGLLNAPGLSSIRSMLLSRLHLPNWTICRSDTPV